MKHRQNNQAVKAVGPQLPGFPSRGPSPAPHSLQSPRIQLYRNIGNQAVQRMLEAKTIQAKLKIGEPDDDYEEEADRTADQVMRMPISGCPGCQGEEEKTIRTKPLAGEITQSVQRQAAGPVSGDVVQLSRLRDYSDASVPEHDPSRLTDAEIKETNEYKAFMNSELIWQWRDKVTEEEALLTCRLILTNLRDGKAIDWENDARIFMNSARTQLGVAKKATKKAKKAKNLCGHPYFKGIDGLPQGSKTWYPHDFTGTKDADFEMAKASEAGYIVPDSKDAGYNCMGWALCHSQLDATHSQGVSRTADHPWPEEEFLDSKGCTEIKADESADHKVKLYEYLNEDQFHIVRQEHDGLWSSKVGHTDLWRGIRNADSHTEAKYKPMAELRPTYWSCP